MTPIDCLIIGSGPAGYTALVTVGDISLGHLLSGGLHEFQLHAVLNLLHCHLFLAGNSDAVGDFVD